MIVHTNRGLLLVAVWYRPPCLDEVESVKSFAEELAKLQSEAVGRVVCGDMNVHNKAWLKFSSGNTSEGEALQKVCQENGLS